MTMLEEGDIFITESDREKLVRIVESKREPIKADRENLEMLREELDRAEVVEASQMPPDAVTMNSQVQVLDLDSGKDAVYTLVFPEKADISRNRISVLSPVGSAILGYRVGDVIEWRTPGGVRRLKVKKIIHEPESGGSVPQPARSADFSHDRECRI